MKYKVLKHASIKIETNNKIIYFDPYNIDQNKKADYIFITHDHYDHYDEKTIINLMTKKTKIIAPTYLKDMVSTLTENYLLVEVNKKYTIDDISFETVPSYNLNKDFHRQEKGNVGYILDIENQKIYIMGDTDVLEEQKHLTVDICFIPIGGKYTMDYQEAADYINELKPKKVIPIHYGSIVGDLSLKDKFEKIINKEINVEIFIK